MTCESVRELLALSAAGLLDASEDRRVREHARECAGCAASLETLGGIAGALRRMSAPPPPAGLVYRTQMLAAAEADRRQGARLAIASGVLGSLLALATWQAGSALGWGEFLRFWALWSISAGAIGSAAVAALVTRRRAGRNWR